MSIGSHIIPDPNKPKPYYCEHCGKWFSSPGVDVTLCLDCELDGHCGPAIDCDICHDDEL